jgi:hypothetical protein
MKNLIYVFTILIIGLASCGAPAEKEASCDTNKEVQTCSSETEKACCKTTLEGDSTKVSSCEKDSKEACCKDKKSSSCEKDSKEACSKDK